MTGKEARDIFIRGNQACEAALTRCPLDGYVTDHVHLRQVSISRARGNSTHDSMTRYHNDRNLGVGCAVDVNYRQEQSKLYRCLIAFEPDIKRQLAMHQRRIDGLEPLLQQISQTVYLTFHKEVRNNILLHMPTSFPLCLVAFLAFTDQLRTW